MPTAELIAIGTELLLGEIQDTNSRYLARQLRDLGVDLYRTSTIGDNEERIAALIQEALGRSQIIITTGGLGPTVDDPTRQAVALALGVSTVFRADLWDQIQERFQRYGRVASGNNQRQAYIPADAIPVENPVGTAPAFICEVGDACIASLPGVPREMEYLFTNAIAPYLREKYRLTGIIKARVLHTAGAGESVIDDLIGDLEKQSNPTVGLLAHPGQVDVRITAKADSAAEADRLIAVMEQEIRQRLGDSIYGADGDTIESTLRSELERRKLILTAFECNLKGELQARLGGFHLAADVQIENGNCEPADLERLASENSMPGKVTVAASLQPGQNKLVLTVLVCTAQGCETLTRYYGGPPQHGPVWSANTALDFLRRKLIDSPES
jgi:competence/damage-inducible protein CinA-like protein